MDASGSMANMGTEPVEAVNIFITDQKELSTDPDARLSLYTFNTKTTTVYNEAKLCEIEEFKNYIPKGFTALYECVHLAITEKLAGDRKENVCLVIVSDGMENSSAPEYTKDTLDGMITSVKRDHNWQVMYLGANINAFTEGNKIGASRHHCAQFDQDKKGDLCQLLRATSTVVNHYRQSAYGCLQPGELDLTRTRTEPPPKRETT